MPFVIYFLLSNFYYMSCLLRDLTPEQYVRLKFTDNIDTIAENEPYIFGVLVFFVAYQGFVEIWQIFHYDSANSDDASKKLPK